MTIVGLEVGETVKISYPLIRTDTGESVVMTAAITLIIGNKAYSSWSLRPWLALKRTGQVFEETLIPLRQLDTRARIGAVSPSGTVPVLIDRGVGDEPVVVWDSLAVCEYVAERFPDARLWPEDRAARAIARAVAAEMHAGFVPLRTHMSMNLKERLPGTGCTPEVEANIARITALWADARTRFGQGGDFLFGRFSIADAMFAPVVTRFETYGVALPPVARAYADAVLALPAMQEWMAAAVAEPWTL